MSSCGVATLCKAHIGLARLYLDVRYPALALEEINAARALLEGISSPSAFLACALHIQLVERSYLWLPHWDKGDEL